MLPARLMRSWTVRGEVLAGIAVHVGARFAHLAAPGEVLVTSTVRELIAGSGIEFSDHSTTASREFRYLESARRRGHFNPQSSQTIRLTPVRHITTRPNDVVEHIAEDTEQNSLCQQAVSGPSGRGRDRSGLLAGGRRVVQGSGSDCAEEPVFRCEPVTQAAETFLKCPARTRLSPDGDASDVGNEVPPDDVAESPFEGERIASRGVLPSASLRS